MHLIVHAGMEKTGSSALQEYLYRHRDELRAIGVIYPDLGHRSHWLFAAAIGGRREKSHYFERRMEKRDLGNTEEHVLETVRSVIVNARDDEVIILSHEGLGKRRQCARLHRFLIDCGVRPERLHVLAYIRNPVDHFPSAIQQHLKSRTGKTTPPGSWVSDHMATACDLINEFGSNLALRAYSRETLIGGDIIEDFGQFVSRRAAVELPSPPRRIATNTSLSAQACALLQMAKSIPGRLLEGHDSVMLRGKLFKYDPELPGTRLQAPEEWRAWVAMANREQWNPLIDRLEYGEDIKRRLRLPIVVPRAPVNERDVKLWIMNHYDPDYTREFARLWTADLRYRNSPAAGVLSWLGESPKWMLEFDRNAILGRNSAQTVKAR